MERATGINGLQGFIYKELFLKHCTSWTDDFVLCGSALHNHHCRSQPGKTTSLTIFCNLYFDASLEYIKSADQNHQDE